MEGYDIGVHSLLFSVPSLVIGLCDNWYLLKIEVFVRVKHILVYGIMIYHLRIVLILCPFSKIIVICSFLGSITCLFALFCYQIWILSYGVELVSKKLVVDYPPTFVAILYQWTYLVVDIIVALRVHTWVRLMHINPMVMCITLLSLW